MFPQKSRGFYKFRKDSKLHIVSLKQFIEFSSPVPHLLFHGGVLECLKKSIKLTGETFQVLSGKMTIILRVPNDNSGKLVPLPLNGFT